MNIKNITICVAAASTMFVAGIASATSLVQTKTGSFTFSAFDGTSQNISVIGSNGLKETFNPFDAALGTLQSVDVSWVIGENVNVTIGANFGGGISFEPSGTFFIGSIGYDGYGNNINRGSASGSVLSVDKPFSKTHNFVVPWDRSYDPAIQSIFTGSNSFDLQWATGARNLAANNIASGTMNFSHSASVTYNYLAATPPVAAIPEPETYALMLAGLGTLGFVARRRKSL